MKPPTPLPPVTVIHRDAAPFLTEAGTVDEPTKQWSPLSIRIDDATLRRLDVLKQRYPDVSKAQIVRDAIWFYSRNVNHGG
jgi:hypothetical protein